MSPIAKPRRIWNPPNPFLGEHRELVGEPPRAELAVYEDASRSILNKNDSPDLGFRWSVNPYRGCLHACAYCYARTTHEYFGLGAGTDFERKIFVKRRAAELLDKALSRPSWRGELIAFSGVTDCYQPIEAGFRLTRACLEVCARHENPIVIATKSRLIRRDLDVLTQLNEVADVLVAFSIPFASEDLARKIEPGAPTIRGRFETMEVLARAGIPVGIGIAPIIPGLNESEIPELLQEAKRRGARFAFRTLLRLSGSVREVFFRRVEEELPERAAKIEGRIRDVRGGKLSEGRFGRRQVGVGSYWDMIDRVWRLWTERLDLDPGELRVRGSVRRQRPVTNQMEMFDT